MLFLDGVYISDTDEQVQFVSVLHHRVSDIVNLTHKISLRIARYLERSGLIERDAESCYLSTDAVGADIREDQSYSINYRISIGSQKGKKVFALQTLPPMAEEGQGTE